MVILAGTLIGCNSNTEVEMLKKENEELKGQINQLNSTVPTSEDKGKNTKIPIEIVSQEATKTEYGYSHANFTVKNISGNDINTLTLNIKIFDKNKTVIKTTHPQEGVVIADGESIIFDAMAEEGAYSMKLDGYSYYKGTDFESDYIQGHFFDTEEVILN